MQENLIEIKNVSKIFETKNTFLAPKQEAVHALKNVSLEIKRGEIVGLVGESGSGKSTLGNCILKLLDVNEGEILYDSKNIKDFTKTETKAFRVKNQKLKLNKSKPNLFFSIMTKIKNAGL